MHQGRCLRHCFPNVTIDCSCAEFPVPCQADSSLSIEVRKYTWARRYAIYINLNGADCLRGGAVFRSFGVMRKDYGWWDEMSIFTQGEWRLDRF